MRKRLNPKTPDQEFTRAIRANRVLKTLFKVMFDQENRIRALEGLPPVTKAQAKAAIRTMFTE